MSINELDEENEEELPDAIKRPILHALRLYGEVEKQISLLVSATEKLEAKHPEKRALIQINILHFETQLKNILVRIEVAIEAAEERSANSSIEHEKVVLDLWRTTEELSFEMHSATVVFVASITQLADMSGQLDIFQITNPFGLPEGINEFHFDSIMEMAKKNGYAGKEQNLIEQLNHHEHNTTRLQYRRAKKNGYPLDWTPKEKLILTRESFTDFLEKRVPKWRKEKE